MFSSARSYKKELLDRDDIPFEDIKRNMYELDRINTLLGGHDITISGLTSVLRRSVKAETKAPLLIAEIGCGGGDNLAAISKWCERKRINVDLVGIDINPACIAYARSKDWSGSIQFITSDYRTFRFEQKPDIIFTSLFCHHFDDEELVSMCRWFADNSVHGFFINDLHRHRLAYYAIKVLTSLFSRSYLVKNDAPLSVERGFSKSELQSILQRAGIPNPSIQWKWAFRWLIVAEKTSHQ